MFACINLQSLGWIRTDSKTAGKFYSYTSESVKLWAQSWSRNFDPYQMVNAVDAGQKWEGYLAVTLILINVIRNSIFSVFSRCFRNYLIRKNSRLGFFTASKQASIFWWWRIVWDTQSISILVELISWSMPMLRRWRKSAPLSTKFHDWVCFGPYVTPKTTSLRVEIWPTEKEHGGSAYLSLPHFRAFHT